MCKDWHEQDTEIAKERYARGDTDAAEFVIAMRKLGFDEAEIVRDLVSTETDREALR